VGEDIKTTLRFDGRIHEGTLRVEGGALVFEGGVTLTIPLGEVFSAEANANFLDLKTSRGLLMLELGAKALRWAEKIKSPGALAARLGVDATKKVAVLGKLDADLRGEIDVSGAKVGKVTAAVRGKGFDVVFLAVAAKADLEKMPTARELIVDEGAVWAVFATPKKVASPDELRERDVILSGRVLGLTDGKPQRLDDATTAIRFVVPPSARKKK
jgi:hypothetical protein